MATRVSWRERYAREVENSIKRYNDINAQLPCTVRKMTEKEFEEIFGEKRESVHKLKVKE